MGKVKGRKARTCRRTHGSSQNIAEDETGKSKDIMEVDLTSVMYLHVHN